MRTAVLAKVQNMPLSGHLLPELGLGLPAAIPTAHRLGSADMMETILQTPLETRDGAAVTRETAGFGPQ